MPYPFYAEGGGAPLALRILTPYPMRGRLMYPCTYILSYFLSCVNTPRTIKPPIIKGRKKKCAELITVASSALFITPALNMGVIFFFFSLSGLGSEVGISLQL
ncbi:MAG: hypothetical protein KatS3mg054_0224 [Chloroflexus sp.]|nr:MAG: hypothetical protein KatS3mg054_0224 [Chloroflexus sp.]